MSKQRPGRRHERSYKRRSRGISPPPKAPNRIALISITVALLVGVAGVIWYRSQPPAALAGKVETYESEGSDHIPVGEKATYKSDPPHSGPHYGQVAPAGFYDEVIPDEVLVHNLEHGHIIVFYDPAALTQEDETYLTRLTNSYTGAWDAVVAVPREGMDHPFILSAWRRLLRLDRLDSEPVEAFLDAYRGRGPENPVR